ncbi:MAG TPA: glycoside hydrolase family 3 N-terminal domain-containing protein, partial [Bryobacteraceae bacterium]|nr:glycoside hydrolase family 3 N-terminal domain-containing protein [Bryobacteraceae bacterium]
RLQKSSRIPLLVGADFERGASMRVNSTVPWPANMAFGAARDAAAVREEGAETAREARALGVNWVFAPDADVNNNPDNPIINTRSYGEDPQQVARLVQAYIEGAHSDRARPILVTAKHFPGHGDTAEDSHMGLARLDATHEHIETVELVPFRAAIAAGVDAIMTAHMAVPALEPQNIPATVSRAVLTGVLRNELGFHGLVVTDAMDMLGLSKMFDSGEASVRALEAGVDMLLIPSNPEQAIAGVVAAVRSGRISRARLDESVARVLDAKIRLGLTRRRTVDVEAVGDTIDDPHVLDIAQRVADEAVTLLKNEKLAVPLAAPANSCLSVLTGGRYSQYGRQMMHDFRETAPGMKISVFDPSTPAAELQRAAQEDAPCAANIVAAFAGPSAYKGNVALPDDLAAFVNTLTKGTAPVVMVALGNPYLLRSFPNVSAYLATFSTATTSETAAVRALLGRIPINGHTPVSIPGFAAIGDGIQLPAAVTAAPR